MDYTKAQALNCPALPYDEARLLIRNGDLVSFRIHDNNLLHRLVRRVTKSEYYHSAIAVWLRSSGSSKRLFVCEAHSGGRRLVPLSHYRGYRFDVVECPAIFKAFEPALMEPKRPVPYGFKDYIAVGMRILFGTVIKDQNGEICSETCQKMYEIGGFQVPNFILAPNELQNYLLLNGAKAKVSVLPY